MSSRDGANSRDKVHHLTMLNVIAYMREQIMIRDALRDSELFIEGTEFFTRGNVVNTYYGFNVTKTDREPIDQVHAFLSAKRIQEHNLKHYGQTGQFFPFVAGVFEVLNAKDERGIQRILKINVVKDARKKQIFEKLMREYGINGKVYLTQDLWKASRYWAIFKTLFESGQFTKGQLIRDTMKFYDTEEQLMSVSKVSDIPSEIITLPADLLNLIGDWPAAIIYTPAEVAEAIFFSQEEHVNLKIGHVEERVYDKYLMSIMDVVHLRQPVDMLSRRGNPMKVTPYIAKHRRKKKIRIFFDDTVDSIRGRIANVEIEDYIYAIDATLGEVLNPFVEKVVFAVEAARCLRATPLKVGGVRLSTGRDVVASLHRGDVTVKQLASQMPDLVSKFVIAPVR